MTWNGEPIWKAILWRLAFAGVLLVVIVPLLWLLSLWWDGR